MMNVPSMVHTIEIQIKPDNITFDFIAPLLELNRTVFEEHTDPKPSIYLDQEELYYSVDSVGVDLMNQLPNHPVTVIIDPKTFKKNQSSVQKRL